MKLTPFLMPLLVAGATAQTVLDTKLDGEPRRVLEAHLHGMLRGRFAERRKAIAAIKTRDGALTRRKLVRETLRRVNGELPPKTPLAARVVGRIARAGYRVEKVIYESRPRHHVTANLYVPDGVKAPVPGVLIPCGHSQKGKAEPLYQRMAISLAQHGMVALCYDPIGQGERHQILGENGKPRVTGTTEHTLVGTGALLVGRGTAHYRIWDGIRSLDYLASRPEVDASRLGCTGNSGGGTLTSYLMAFDERIVAAAPSCYLTTFERLFATIGPQDAEQNFPDQVMFGLDHADFVTARAPQPTLILCATRDFFDIDGTWTTFREAKRLYGLLGHGERVGIFEYDDKHGFSEPRREAALRWMRRWLLGEDDAAKEKAMQLATPRELQCTESGEVLVDFPKGRSVVDLNVERARQLAEERPRKDGRGLVLPPHTANRFQVPEPARVRAAGTVTVDGVRLEKLVLTRPGEVPVPALLFQPRERTRPRAPAVLWVGGKGKSAGHGARAWKRFGPDRLVLSIDVRGVGETRAGYGRRFSDWFGSDFGTSFLAMHAGRPLLTQRAEDVVAALAYLRSRTDVDPEDIDLAGTGICGPVVLHAAWAAKQAPRVTHDSIETWLEVVKDPLMKDQLCNVVPFVLQYYDLPDLVEWIGRDRVTKTKL